MTAMSPQPSQSLTGKLRRGASFSLKRVFSHRRTKSSPPAPLDGSLSTLWNTVEPITEVPIVPPKEIPSKVFERVVALLGNEYLEQVALRDVTQRANLPASQHPYVLLNSLKCLSQVSRRLRELSAPYLFQTLQLSNHISPSNAAFLSAEILPPPSVFQAHPPLYIHVRHLQIKHWSVAGPGWKETPEEEMFAVLDELSKMHQLSTLTVEATNGAWNDVDAGLRRRILALIAASPLDGGCIFISISLPKPFLHSLPRTAGGISLVAVNTDASQRVSIAPTKEVPLTPTFLRLSTLETFTAVITTQPPSFFSQLRSLDLTIPTKYEGIASSQDFVRRLNALSQTAQLTKLALRVKPDRGLATLYNPESQMIAPKFSPLPSLKHLTLELGPYHMDGMFCEPIFAGVIRSYLQCAFATIQSLRICLSWNTKLHPSETEAWIESHLGSTQLDADLDDIRYREFLALDGKFADGVWLPMLSRLRLELRPNLGSCPPSFEGRGTLFGQKVAHEARKLFPESQRKMKDFRVWCDIYDGL